MDGPFASLAYHEPVSARCKFTVTFLDSRLNIVLLQESCFIAKPYYPHLSTSSALVSTPVPTIVVSFSKETCWMTE